jgi:hypothetical protein
VVTIKPKPKLTILSEKIPQTKKKSETAEGIKTSRSRLAWPNYHYYQKLSEKYSKNNEIRKQNNCK